MKKYFRDISDGIFSVMQGMKLTMRHFVDARTLHSPDNVQNANYFKQDSGIVTLQYPFEEIPVPDNGRYRLHNEIDDCIVCDKCAVVCPVNCIEIETIKSPEPIGETSDGSVKRLYAGKFNIDMAKCCFCGLCTTVCPTECLTMTKAYDFSEFDVKNMNYHFSDLSPKMAEEKKGLYEQFVKEKEDAKKKTEVVSGNADLSKTGQLEEIKKPVFKPMMKPTVKLPDQTEAEQKTTQTTTQQPISSRPVIMPLLKMPEEPDVPGSAIQNNSNPEAEQRPKTAKPMMKPVFKKPGTTDPIIDS